MNADDPEAERHMRRALRLAVRGMRGSPPNPAVGCVIVNRGRVVGEGWHRRAGEAHAEVLALRQAGAAARGATAYVTLEPCSHHGRTPPCTDALVAAGVRRVVAALPDPNPLVGGGGFAALEVAGIETRKDVCAAAARRLNRGFFSRFERARPWLTLKLAASLDGRSALPGGSSRWITGPIARAAVHRRRARAGAVLTGAGTVRADDPALTARLPGLSRQPLRVVLDSGLRTAPTARLLASAGVHIFCTTPVPARRAALAAAGARIHEVAADSAGRPRIADVLAALAALEVNEVYAECGPGLAGVLLAGGWVDELELFLGPHLLGPAAQALAEIVSPEVIPEPPALDVVAAGRVGRDVRLRLRPRAG